jgi:hypothetical protein
MTEPKPPTRLVVSTGKRAEPRLFMAHKMGPTRRQRIGELLACLVIGFVLAAIFLLAGR